jgi:hypothetical protein
MATVTLLAKAYNDRQLKFVDANLRHILKDLNVQTKVSGVSGRSWVQVTVEGEDEKVAISYLTQQIGFCPINLKNLGRFSTVRGRISALDKSAVGLQVDIGVFYPKTVEAVIPLDDLRSKLADGRKAILAKIAKIYGLGENVPLIVKINKIDIERNSVEAFLSEQQCRLFETWTKSMLDRLIILGASRSEIEFALKRALLNRDVIAIESLGMFEQVAVCKLGTDARGLIPKIGKELRKANFIIFSPKEVLKFLEHCANT